MPTRNCHFCKQLIFQEILLWPLHAVSSESITITVTEPWNDLRVYKMLYLEVLTSFISVVINSKRLCSETKIFENDYLSYYCKKQFHNSFIDF